MALDLLPSTAKNVSYLVSDVAHIMLWVLLPTRQLVHRGSPTTGCVCRCSAAWLLVTALLTTAEVSGPLDGTA